MIFNIGVFSYNIVYNNEINFLYFAILLEFNICWYVLAILAVLCSDILLYWVVFCQFINMVCPWNPSKNHANVGSMMWILCCGVCNHRKFQQTVARIVVQRWELDQVSHKLVYLGLLNGVAMGTGAVTLAPIFTDSSVFRTILQTQAAPTRSNPGYAAGSAGLSSCPRAALAITVQAARATLPPLPWT